MRKIVIAIALITVVSLITVGSLFLMNSEVLRHDEKIELNLLLIKCKMTTGEEYPLEIIDLDDNANVQWDFGDGNTSTDPAPLVSYERAGKYNITYNAHWDGGSGSGSNILVIYNQDEIYEDSGPAMNDISPSTVDSGGIEGIILPGIVSPQIRITISLKEGLGDFHVYGYLHSVETSTSTTLFQDRVRLVNSDREWSYIVNREEICLSGYITFINVGLIDNNGRCGEWEVKAELFYAYGIPDS